MSNEPQAAPTVEQAAPPAPPAAQAPPAVEQPVAPASTVPPPPPQAAPADVIAPAVAPAKPTKEEKAATKAKKAADKKKKAAEKKAAADKKKADAEAAAVPAAPIQASGRALDVWSDVASTFIPALKKEQTVIERRATVRDCAKQAAQMDDRLNLVLGELLYETSENGNYKEWGFNTFEEYVQDELGMQKSKAHYLKSIYKKFVVELDLDTDTLRNLEWSKAKELTRVIDKTNAKTLLDKIDSMSVKQVQELVRQLRGQTAAATGVTATADETQVPVNFKCAPSQAENIKAALQVAKSMTGSDSNANNMDLICTDFLGGAAGGGLQGVMGRLDVLVKNIGRAFGVTLQVVDHDKDRFEKIKNQDAAQVAADATPATPA